MIKQIKSSEIKNFLMIIKMLSF